MKDIKDQSIAQEAYEFISEELTYYPDLPQYSAEELAEHKDDKELWDKLEEELDCFRICDACGAPMLDGFLVYGADHYCSGECLHTVMTEEEYEKEYEEYDSGTFWTTWYENSRRYIEKK